MTLALKNRVSQSSKSSSGIWSSRRSCLTPVTFSSGRVLAFTERGAPVALDPLLTVTPGPGQTPLTRIVAVAAGVEHREGATAEQRIEAALPPVEQFGDFIVRKGFETAARGDPGVDKFDRWGNRDIGGDGLVEGRVVARDRERRSGVG